MNTVFTSFPPHTPPPNTPHVSFTTSQVLVSYSLIKNFE